MPFDWTSATVGDFVGLQRGNTYQSALLDTPGPVLLGLASIERDGGFRSDKLRTYGGDSQAKLLVYPGDMYVSLKDVTQSGDLLGSVARVPDFIAEGRMTQDTVKLVFKNDLIDRSYLYWVLRTPEYRDYCRARGMGTTNLSLSRIDFLSFPVPEPTPNRLAIQRALDAIESKIALNGDICRTLETVAQALFKSWFVDFDPVKAKIAAMEEGLDPLRAAMSVISGTNEAGLDALPSEQFEQLAATAALFPAEMEESELRKIPKRWSRKALAQLTDKIGSGSTPRGGKEVYLEEGVALIRSQNVYDSLFVWEGLARISDDAAAQLKSVTVQEDDVLLNITGASILRTCVVEPAALPARVNQHVAIIRAKDGVPSRFIHMQLLRADIKSYLLGLNAGASREAITKAHIESLILLTPTPELLAAFQTATDPLFRQVQRFAQQIRLLGELRDTLLPKLLSGELSVEALVEPVEPV